MHPVKEKIKSMSSETLMKIQREYSYMQIREFFGLKGYSEVPKVKSLIAKAIRSRGRLLLVYTESNDSSELRFRVDTFGSRGWQHTASFANETDAYKYGERYSIGGARVWDGEECIAATHGRKSWHKIKHNRHCDGKPCECGAVTPIGSMSKG